MSRRPLIQGNGTKSCLKSVTFGTDGLVGSSSDHEEREANTIYVVKAVIPEADAKEFFELTEKIKPSKEIEGMSSGIKEDDLPEIPF